MRYDLSSPEESCISDVKYQTYKAKGAMIDMKECRTQRTPTQNSSIHLYCTMISIVLNDSGQSFTYKNLVGKNIEVPYTMEIVKTTIWKPIQRVMFNIESTTDLNTKQVSEVAFVIEAHFAPMGFILKFPNKKDKDKKDNKPI